MASSNLDVEHSGIFKVSIQLFDAKCNEIARWLHEISIEVEEGVIGADLIDLDGNKFGQWELVETPI